MSLPFLAPSLFFACIGVLRVSLGRVSLPSCNALYRYFVFYLDSTFFEMARVQRAERSSLLSPSFPSSAYARAPSSDLTALPLVHLEIGRSARVRHRSRKVSSVGPRKDLPRVATSRPQSRAPYSNGRTDSQDVLLPVQGDQVRLDSSSLTAHHHRRSQLFIIRS